VEVRRVIICDGWLAVHAESVEIVCNPAMLTAVSLDMKTKFGPVVNSDEQ